MLGWGLMGLSEWRKDAVAGTPHLDLHYELYTRRDVPAVRIVYGITERGNPLEYDTRLQTTQPLSDSRCDRISLRAGTFALEYAPRFRIPAPGGDALTALRTKIVRA